LIESALAIEEWPLGATYSGVTPFNRYFHWYVEVYSGKIIFLRLFLKMIQKLGKPTVIINSDSKTLPYVFGMNPICISVPPSSLSGSNSPKFGVTVKTWSPAGEK
jgi:hypothetical protein